MSAASRPALPAGPRRADLPLIAVIVCAAIAAGVIGSSLVIHVAGQSAQTVVAGPQQTCDPQDAAPWYAAGKSGTRWAVVTNLLPCEQADALVAKVAGLGVVALGNVSEFRCTARAMDGANVLAGICYAADAPDGYVAWGADTPPYSDPGPCDRCSGIPGEHLDLPAGGIRPGGSTADTGS